jgi:ribose transport system permease protein
VGEGTAAAVSRNDRQRSEPIVTTASPKAKPRLFGRAWSGVAILLVFYIALVAVFSALSPYFFTPRNMLAIGSNIAFIGLMAAAGTPLIIAGGLDLSVAAVAGLVGIVIALVHGAGYSVWLGVALAVALGALVGFANGLLTTRLRLNPLIVTLGTMSIVSGAALLLTGGLTKPLMVPSFNWIGSGRVFGVPVPPILMLIVYLALSVWLRRTVFGRHVYAIGGNAEASRLIGLPVARVQIILYIVSGVSGAVAGAILAAMLGAAAPNAAAPHLLTVIAAIILGGTSLNGGRGSVWGTLLAVLILGTLNNGLTLLDVSSFSQEVTRGIVLLGAVSLDQIRIRLQEG